MKKPVYPLWCLLFCIALALIPWLLLGSGWPTLIVDRLGHCKELYCDFAKHYYPQAKHLVNGGSGMVDGWFYPPTLALMISGLGHVDLSTATDIWTAVSLSVTITFILICAQSLKFCGLSTIQRYFLSTAVVSTSFPVLSSLKWGQVSLLIVVLIILALRRQTQISGWLLGLAGAIKLYPLILSFVPLLKRQLTTLGIIALSAILFGLILPVMALGIEAVLLYYDALIENNQTLQMRAPSWGGQAWAPSAHRWFIAGDSMINRHPEPLLFAIPSVLFTLSNLLIMAVLGIASLSVYQRTDSQMGLAVLLCWFGLFSPPGWHHYFCFLPFSQLVIWKNANHSAQRVLVGTGFLFERTAVLGLMANEEIYYLYSQYGGTTVVTMLTLVAGIWGTKIAHLKSIIPTRINNQKKQTNAT